MVAREFQMGAKGRADQGRISWMRAPDGRTCDYRGLVELRRYWHLIRRRLILVLISILLGAGIGYATTSRASLYKTSAELYVGSLALAQNPGQLYLETQLSQVELTYTAMINAPTIAEKAVALTNVPRAAGTLSGETKATVIPGTNLIVVTATDPDPIVAQKIANGMSTAFVKEVQSFSPTSNPAPGTVPSEPVELFQGAFVPNRPLPTGLGRKVLLGAIFGLVISVLLVLVLDYLDITIKSADELERRLDLPVLGVVPLRRNVPESVSLG